MTTAFLHAGVFKSTDCIRERRVQVQCFIRSARMTAQRWRIAIFADNVLVMTAQQLLNMLNLDVAALQQIDLLVLVLTHLPPNLMATSADMLFNVLCCAVLCTVLCCAVLCCAVPCHAMLCAVSTPE